MAFSFPTKFSLSRSNLPPVFPPVPIQIAILAAEFPALVPGRIIVAAVQIAPQFPPVVSNPALIVPDVPP